MTDPARLVGDALFTADLDRQIRGFFGDGDVASLTDAVLRALTAHGWRIVRTGVTIHEQVDTGPTQALAFIVEEWKP